MSLYRANFSKPQQFTELEGAKLTFTNYEVQDTFKYTDFGLNTKAGMYFYKAILTDKNLQKFESQPASSPFINSESLNSNIKLFCDVTVPWIIDFYNLYKYKNETGQYLLIASHSNNTLIDNDVVKTQEYCYKVLTIGHFPNETFKLYNFSQIVCAVPEDKQAPCAPQISAKTNCDTEYDFIPQSDLFTYLKWSNPSLTCENSDDIQYFNIYYSKSKDSTFSLLFKISDADKTDTVHLSPDFAGCYYMTAVDSTGNESVLGNTVCVEKCPAYILPNTFTPNGDQQNDLLIPIYKRHIDKIELKIYNSWGVMVYETNDPAINWDGTDKSGKKLNSGSYYYICQPFSVDMKLLLQSGFIAILY
jgi:gliding motility-associated-like protein